MIHCLCIFSEGSWLEAVLFIFSALWWNLVSYFLSGVVVIISLLFWFTFVDVFVVGSVINGMWGVLTHRNDFKKKKIGR